MSRAKKLLRGAQRRANAAKKKNFMEKVMKASSNDNKPFYQLVRNQRKTPRTNTSALTLNGCLVLDKENILDG